MGFGFWGWHLVAPVMTSFWILAICGTKIWVSNVSKSWAPVVWYLGGGSEYDTLGVTADCF